MSDHVGEASDMSCACGQCVKACQEGAPGWFAPGEAELAAVLMGLPFDEFVDKFLVKDYWINYGAGKIGKVEGDIFVWAPRKVGQAPGLATWGSAFLPGKCVFLDESDRCSIHVAKPMECRLSFGCDDPRDQADKGDPGSRREIARLWLEKGNPLA